MSKLDIWNSLEKTDPQYTKKFDKGVFKGTAINPTYQIRKMTETFGPIGDGWGYNVKSTQIVPAQETSEVLVYVTVTVWTKGNPNTFDGVGGDYIVRQGKNGPRSNDEGMKSATTDALMNAFKFLGMSADVYLGRYDDNKYVAELTEEMKQPEEKFTQEQRSLQAEVITRIAQAKDVVEIDAIADEYSIKSLPEEMSEQIYTQIEIREKQIKDGIHPQVTSHKFVSVDDQRNWVKKMLTVIKGIKTPDQLERWKEYNAPFIQGLSDKATKNSPVAPRAFFLAELDKRANELVPVG